MHVYHTKSKEEYTKYPEILRNNMSNFIEKCFLHEIYCASTIPTNFNNAIWVFVIWLH